MAHFRVFHGGASGGDPTALAAEVNAWLDAERPRILNFAQSAWDGVLVVSFVYELDVEETAAPLAEAAEVPRAFEQGLDEAELDPSSETPLLPEAELPF